jgi:hypothetical protein
LSIDPVTTDADTGASFNRYNYANNSPYKYVDPDGRNAVTAALKGAAIGAAVEIGWQIVIEEKSIGELNKTDILIAAGIGGTCQEFCVLGPLV